MARGRVRRALRRPLGRARRTLRSALGPDPDPRRRLGERYLCGNGVEIGALTVRLPAARGARVRYVDRLTVAEMRVHYPELDGLPLVPPDIVDDGGTLASIPDASLDFVAASHTIEHLEDPIGALASQLRALRPGGVLFLAVPDGRATFDRVREPTTLAHLERDHAEGPEWSRRAHYEEWVRMSGQDGEDARATVERLVAERYAIHFHVWTPAAFLELLAHCRDRLGFPFELELFERSGPEFFVVLAKTG